MSDQRYYLLSKHEATFDKGMCMWWRPDAKGYTVFIESAGLYSADEARRHVGEHTFAIPENVVTTNACTVVYVDDKAKIIQTAVRP